ncbi:MAG: YbaN family protein [Clostridia bacterium]|jgi:uncharacterized membrane protein YbaN (DUF454 family)|nr:YbaN family protein [Clostridia bacterium]MCI1958067.1 YbaN family protein [Clostridia bacterium]MCI1999361.1 YbaN family protein [Clostridia bacterium]MCI2015137.1 YbaN family protein [Clostridia bacterium]
MKKYMLFALGILSFIVGTVGLLIPIFPTVPFYLITIYCLSKSSERFKNWIEKQRFYKKYLEKFIKNKI